ncbi:hypothetical protein IJS18_01220 [Candidatus Saccharibacteria bacterium]|nr:hypothetical protein [Candidatus Saccharibacteria bacterium]
MSAEDILRSSETSALSNNQIISNVTGNKQKSKKKRGSSFVLLFLTSVIGVFLAFFSTGNLIPSALSERLIEQTDIQYADAFESKLLVFQQAMQSGDVPDNTAEKLKIHGATLGYNTSGGFTEANKGSGALSLLFNDKVISAGEIISAVHSDAKLYEAINSATYSRAAYYYDDSALSVFKKLGASRNIYKDEDVEFEEAMSKAMGEGSSIDVNNVGLFEKTKQNEDGSVDTYYEYGQVGSNASSGAADTFVESVRSKNTAESSSQATLNAADAINVADTMSKEQRSSLFFLAFMENISKMKAGLGSETRINDAMNYLYHEEESEVVDVKTGEIVKSKGSMLEAKSLYSILADEKIDVSDVENYSSDRVLKTVENQLGTSGSGNAITGTVVSKSKGLRAVIGRFINWGEEALGSVLGKVSPTVNSSLVENSFESIKGINGGELLAEGAVNVGKELAKASGATPGDASSVKTYARLTNTILALDAEVDRMNRSPFDITSRNTFLGSIVYKFAVGMVKNGSIMNKIGSFMSVTSSAFHSLLPAALADDEVNSFLTNFGNCETLGTIGAVGSASCAMVATFDTSTLSNTFSDAGFIAFVEANTTLNSSGVRTINDGSTLANFIKYNDERSTPVGTVDGGILDSISNNTRKVSFISNILKMILRFLNANESEKRLASGAAFMTSSSNPDWNQYKYAQRYVSLARATEALRRYDGGATAYSNIRFFEGTENPVIAYINEYIASNQE